MGFSAASALASPNAFKNPMVGSTRPTSQGIYTLKLPAPTSLPKLSASCILFANASHTLRIPRKMTLGNAKTRIAYQSPQTVPNLTKNEAGKAALSRSRLYESIG